MGEDEIRLGGEDSSNTQELNLSLDLSNLISEGYSKELNMLSKKLSKDNKDLGSITPTTFGGKKDFFISNSSDTQQIITTELKNYYKNIDIEIKSWKEKENKIQNLLENSKILQDSFLKKQKELAKIMQQDNSNVSTVSFLKPFEDKLVECREQIKYLEKTQKLNADLDKLKLDKSKVLFIRDYQENIRKIDGKILDKVDKKPYIQRFAVNTEFIKPLTDTLIKKGTLHPIEKILFEEAFNFLKNKTSARDYVKKEKKDEYPDNVVLVDMFARDGEAIKNEKHSEICKGEEIKKFTKKHKEQLKSKPKSISEVNAEYKIKYKKKKNDIETLEKITLLNQPETHTVVLWKKTPNKIILIDPSKVAFSSYLADIFKESYKINCETIKANNFVIYGTQGNLSGYSPYAGTNVKPRDCIDISAKISLELLEQQQKVSKVEVIQGNMLEQISNNKEKAKHMRKVQNLFVRHLQSSNSFIRNIAKQILETAGTSNIIDNKK